MKRGLIIALPVILVVLIGAALVIPKLIDPNQYKTQIQEQIKTATGLDAQLRGNISLALLPTPAAYINDVMISSPQGSTNDYLAKVVRLDAHLVILPLLSGVIALDSVNLEQPYVALEIFKDGTKNWMTPELQKMMGGQASAPGASPSVSLRNVSITKGNFIYKDDTKDAAATTISDVNVNVQAETLSGPFKVYGSITMAGQTIKVKADTSAIDKSQSLTVNAKGSVDPANVSFEYAGVVTTTAPFQAQGETSLSIDSLKKLMGPNAGGVNIDSIKLKGLLTATQNDLNFKNATFSLDKNQFSGDLSAALSPMKISGDFKAADLVNLDKMISSGGEGASKNLSPQLLPDTIIMPVSFDAAIKFTAPGVIYHNQIYKDVSVLFSKQDKSIAAEATSNAMPGSASVDAKAALVFGASSVSKDKSQIYSDPSLVVAVTGQTKNLAATVSALTGVENPAYLNIWKTATLDAHMEVKPDALVLKDTSVKLGDDVYAVNGSYAAKGARPKLTASIAAEKLDIDALQAKMASARGGAAAKGSLADTLRSLSLPFDMDFDFGVQAAHFQKQDIKGLRAQGSLKENSLTFTNLSAQDFAGSALKISGGIGDLKKLSGVNVTLAGESKDIKGLAKVAGMDVGTLPASLNAASASIAAKGDLNKLAVTANVKALDGNIIAQGEVGDPMGKIAFTDLALQLKYPNLAQAIQAFSPNSPRYSSLEKPLDFYAKINRAGNVYSLQDMKASVAGSPVTGSLSVDVGAAKPTVKADLTFTDLNIQSGAASGGGSGSSASKEGGKWSRDPIDTNWMNAYEADIAVKANSIIYQTWNLQKPVISVALHNGKLDVSKLTAGMSGGQMDITADAQAGAGGKGFAPFNATAKFSDVSIEELTKGLLGTQLIKGQGAVSLDTTIASSGASQADLVSALKGSGTMNGKNIILDGFDFSKLVNAVSGKGKPTDRLGGLFYSAFSGGSTAFDTLDGACTITQGIVNISKLNLDGSQGTLGTAGSVNIPQWTIDTTFTGALKTQTAGQEKPPSFTYKYSGSLDNPTGSFLGNALQNYLNSKLTDKLDNMITKKLGLPAGLLGGGTPQAAPAANGASGTATTPQPATSGKVDKGEALKNVLKGLLQ